MSTSAPVVLFICKSNAGKSQMAEALLRQVVGAAVEIHSAGTDPKTDVNEQSARAVHEVGADMSTATPKGVDPDLLRNADRVIVLGREAQVAPVEGMRATIETWETDEPSTRGIEGEERMRLVRDDIADRVAVLAMELTGQETGHQQRPAHG